MYKKYAFACGAAAVVGEAAVVGYASSSSSVPDYYVTKPELFPGQYHFTHTRVVRTEMNG